MKCAVVVGMLLLAVGCSDGKTDPPCQGVPDFVVAVSSISGHLPSDTLVSVTFGGGSIEHYSPAHHDEPVVLFCTPRREADLGTGGAGGEGAGGAGAASSETSAGAAGPDSAGTSGSAHTVLRSIECQLWTGGPATFEVKAGTWNEKLELERDPETCTTDEALVLGEDSDK